ncbi:MAG TPA: AAA family ATPase [Thermoanaerobaculia bacterium]|nr:AAA family ATPase [Thermoanaerobaculia bacterium]
MLTRIEIDGFKTFEEFKLDLRPFVVILGPNASGKSNLFDAIRLLSKLADSDLRSAVQGMRGEPTELFRRKSSGEYGKRMSFAVEVLLEPNVRDPWGTEVEIKHSRVRYEVEIERRRDQQGIERLVVVREQATPLLKKEDSWSQKLSRSFADTYIKSSRRTPWLITESPEGKPRSFRISQDGHQGRTRPAEAAEATVLSGVTSAEFPHLYALKAEMRSWRFLQLDPTALRKPSPVFAAIELEPDGSNLATVLARIQAETSTKERPKGILADVAADLATLIPGVTGLSVNEDEKNREYRIDLEMRDGPPFSARVVSDGTLRVLALLTILHDPKHRSLVCFEEPENGVHPVRLKSMIQRFHELVTDPGDEDFEEPEPLTQLLVNSHSPVVLSSLSLKEGEVMFADTVSAAEVEGGRNGVNRRTRIRPIQLDALLVQQPETMVTRHEVNRYLSTVQFPEA